MVGRSDVEIVTSDQKLDNFHLEYFASIRHLSFYEFVFNVAMLSDMYFQVLKEEIAFFGRFSAFSGKFFTFLGTFLRPTQNSSMVIEACGARPRHLVSMLYGLYALGWLLGC